MTDPIRPEEAAARKLAVLPDGVIEAFNDLIARSFDGTRAIVYQGDAVEAIMERCPLVLSRQQVFDDRLLDVEPAYRDAGWLVYFEKPAPGETGRAYFAFTRADEKR